MNASINQGRLLDLGDGSIHDLRVAVAEVYNSELGNHVDVFLAVNIIQLIVTSSPDGDLDFSTFSQEL